MVKRAIRLDSAAAMLGKLAAPALERRSLVTYEAMLAGRCLRPQGVELKAEPDMKRGKGELHYPRDGNPVFVDLEVRCRRCEKCRKARAALWRMRASFELGVANRSWFGTLTLRPEERVRVQFRAFERAEQRGTTLLGQPEVDKFAAYWAQLSPEVTRFIKRVRKQSGALLRYMLVVEQSADGTPHVHLLVHEYREAVRKRLLEEQWRLGFSSWRLVDPDDKAVAAYITKYLAKSMSARIRASLHYGARSTVPLEQLAKRVNLTHPPSGGAEGFD